jgi:dimethylhistidine N-methyltransferase
MDPDVPPAPEFIQRVGHDGAAVRAELATGLLAMQARVAPKFLYDTLGSRLFDAITELPEYTPTRAEAAIFARHGEAIATACGSGGTLVDLGAGNCAKAASLFARLLPRHYVAVDISVDFLRQSLSALQLRHPAIRMLGLELDFSVELQLPDAVAPGPRTLFYPGSSIGNFSPEDALRFLLQVRFACQGGSLLIGVDRVKPRAALELAYDDPLGVTAAFNLNLLRNVNRLLGSNFDERQWQHLALFNDAQSRIEMHLQARQAVSLVWPGGARSFAAGERLHTENSYKYRPGDFEVLLHDAGFGNVQCWTDSGDGFAVYVARD